MVGGYGCCKRGGTKTPHEIAKGTVHCRTQGTTPLHPHPLDIINILTLVPKKLTSEKLVYKATGQTK